MRLLLSICLTGLVALPVSPLAIPLMLPPLVKCVDGIPLGLNLPYYSFPSKFTLRAIAADFSTGSLPIIYNDRAPSAITAARLGKASDRAMEFTLHDGSIATSDGRALAGGGGPYGVALIETSRTGNGVGPIFWKAQYVCTPANTAVLRLFFDGESANHIGYLRAAIKAGSGIGLYPKGKIPQNEAILEAVF